MGIDEDSTEIYIPQYQHTYYVSCGFCGESLHDVSITGRYILIKPCEKCIDYKVKNEIKKIHESYRDHIYNLLKQHYLPKEGEKKNG